MIYDTVIVTGSVHSGTSMAAGVLIHLGVRTGENKHEYRHEDMDFINAETDEIKGLFTERNNIYAQWMVKIPTFIRPIITEAANELKSPFFIVSIRNTKDALKTKRRSGIVTAADDLFVEFYKDTLKDNIKIARKYPHFIYDFNWARNNPQEFVHKIISVLGIKVSAEQITAACQFIGTGYKTIT